MKTVVFIETNFSGLDAFEYCARKGYRSVLVTDNPERFQDWFPKDSLAKLDRVDEVVRVQNSNDFDEVHAAIASLEPAASAVMTFAEIRTRVTARLAKALQLRGTSLAAIDMAQDKHAFRAHMQKSGVDATQSVLAQKPDDLLQMHLTYPTFLKPRSGHSSIHALACFDKAGLHKAVEQMCLTPSEGISTEVMAEDYLQGPLFSVEAITLGPGVHKIWGVSDRDVVHDSVEVGASFPIVGEMQDAIIALVKRSLNALAYDFGPTHTEVILTQDGPRLVEVNTRVGGSGHSVMMDTALRTCVIGECIELALGNPVSTTDSYKLSHQGAAWHCHVSETPGVITGMPQKEALLAMPGVKDVWIHKQLGTRLGHLNSNFHWTLQVLTEGSNAHDARTKAQAAIAMAAKSMEIDAAA